MNLKCLEFEVDWALKLKCLQKLEFGNKLAKAQLPRNAFDKHCIQADLSARVCEDRGLAISFSLLLLKKKKKRKKN